MNKHVVYGLIGIAVLELIAIIALTLQIRNQKFSPYILSLTQPVTTLNGTVKKVSGNTVTVVQDGTNFIAVPPPQSVNGKTSPSPTPQSPSYEIKVDNKTIFSRPFSSIPALFFSTGQSQPAKPTIKDIKQGDRVTIQSGTDLRILGSNRFTAISITLPAVDNYMAGSIANITDKTVLVHGTVGASGGKDYLFNITKDTEISAYASETVEGVYKTAPKRYALSDLKLGQQISVWTHEDITAGGIITAVRIQPVITPAASVAPSATSTLAPTPPIAPIP